MYSVPNCFLIALLLLASPSHAKKIMNYNGNPANKAGITISPRTSPALLASYTTTINLAGLLDQSFANFGIMTKMVATGANAIHAVAVQPDGKILAAGSARVGFSQSFALSRCATTGSSDTTFGPNANGSVTTSFGFGDDVINAIVLQPDGKIVVAGSAAIGGNTIFALARYTANGILDTTFNGTGKITTPLGGTNDQAFAIGIQSNGSIVVAGFANGSEIALARYTSTGILDTSFGTGGGTTVTPLGAHAQAYGLAVQPDDALVITGYTLIDAQSRIIIARYTSSGILDATFGTEGNGITITTIGIDASQAYAITLQPDGKPIITGYTVIDDQNLCVIARYTTAGVLDSTFGTNGITTTPLAIGLTGYAIALQADGKPIVAGYVDIEEHTEFFIARYTINGILDTTFGTNGTITTALGDPTGPDFNAMALQTDQKIVVAGSSQGNSIVARYINPWTLSSLTTTYGGVGML